MAPTPAKGAGSPVGAPRYLKLTLVLDTEFQSRYGADAAATAAALLNIADGLYRAQTDVQLSLHHLRALDDNGPLTSTDTGFQVRRSAGFRPDVRDPVLRRRPPAQRQWIHVPRP